MTRTILISLFLTSAALSAGQTIDTYPGWNGTDHITGFGGANRNTAFGQTFTVSTPSILMSYTSALVLDSGDPFDVRLYVAAWDVAGSHTAGSPLYTSAPLTLPALGAGFADLSVSPNLALAAGVYIAYYSTIETDLSVTGVGGIGTQYGGGLYAEGDFFAAVSSSIAGLGTDAWFTFSPGNDYDTTFRAEFQSVPEPMSIVALALGGAATLRRRRPA